MLETINPQEIMPPFNKAYSHGVVLPANARVLHISGQVGARHDGSVPDSVEEQAQVAWNNVMAIVEGAGMTPADIVKLTAYIVDEAAYAPYAAARKRTFGDATPPASTAICVPRLLLPEWKIEVEAIAAQSS